MFETAVRRMRARTGGTYVLFIKCAYLRGGYVRTSKNRQKSARAVCERSLYEFEKGSPQIFNVSVHFKIFFSKFENST